MDKSIFVIAAVGAELAPLRLAIQVQFEERIGKRSVITGHIGNSLVGLIEAGPGIVNTAQSLTAMVEKKLPSLILMIGCAGGFQQAGLAIGDIGIATEEIDAHLGIEPDENGGLPSPLPFNIGFLGETPVKHRIRLNQDMTLFAEQVIQHRFENERVTIRSGPFITVSTITASDRRAALYYDTYRPCMESMEGVAAAYVAGLYDVPFIEIRAVSNLVGNRNRNAWNIPLACQRSCAAALTLINEIEGAPLQ